jgi:hypothetical protein
MEQLEKSLAREAARLTPQQTQAPTVRSLNDIKRLVAELDPGTQRSPSIVNVATKMESEGQTFDVVVPTKSRTKREILTDVLGMIARRQETRIPVPTTEAVVVDGMPFKPAAIPDGSSGHNWIDHMIKQWFGAYRSGHYICWRLPDGFDYSYDVLTHQLTRTKHDG